MPSAFMKRSRGLLPSTVEHLEIMSLNHLTAKESTTYRRLDLKSRSRRLGNICERRGVYPLREFGIAV